MDVDPGAFLMSTYPVPLIRRWMGCPHALCTLMFKQRNEEPEEL